MSVLALAKKPPKPAPAPPPAATAVTAVARWADGDVSVQLLDAPSCDAPPESERGLLTMRRSDDGARWNLVMVDVHPPDGELATWYADGDWPVTGLEGSATGEVTLGFAPVPLPREDGSTRPFSGGLRAKWCGAPLGDALATLDQGDVVVDLFPQGQLRACGEGWGDRQLRLRRFVDAGAVGWGIESITESESGGVDDFFLDGSAKRPVTGVGAGRAWTLGFAPVPPGAESGRTTTLQGPLRVVWCGEEPPPAVGADAAGATGAWMAVGGRWFPVQGARWSAAEGLELSNLPLSCDRNLNYMDEDVFLTLKTEGNQVTWWSISGRLLGPPRSAGGDTLPAPKVGRDSVDLGGVSGALLGLPVQLQGTAPLVRCD